MHLSMKSTHKRSFITPFDSYEFILMTFGLASSSAALMGLMDCVLFGTDGHAHAYFDDASILSHSANAHIQYLRELEGLI